MNLYLLLFIASLALFAFLYYLKSGIRKKFSQKALEEISDYEERDEVESHIYLNKRDIKTVTDWMYNEGYDYGDIAATAFPLQCALTADQIAGYPPNCNEGYVEKDGKCVPANETE